MNHSCFVQRIVTGFWERHETTSTDNHSFKNPDEIQSKHHFDTARQKNNLICVNHFWLLTHSVYIRSMGLHKHKRTMINVDSCSLHTQTVKTRKKWTNKQTPRALIFSLPKYLSFPKHKFKRLSEKVLAMWYKLLQIHHVNWNSFFSKRVLNM